MSLSLWHQSVAMEMYRAVQNSVLWHHCRIRPQIKPTPQSWLMQHKQLRHCNLSATVQLHFILIFFPNRAWSLLSRKMTQAVINIMTNRPAMTHHWRRAICFQGRPRRTREVQLSEQKLPSVPTAIPDLPGEIFHRKTRVVPSAHGSGSSLHKAFLEIKECSVTLPSPFWKRRHYIRCGSSHWALAVNQRSVHH